MKNRPFHMRLGFALNGIRSTLKTENSFRIQLMAMLVLLPLLIWQKPAPVWWAIFGLAAMAVLAAELFNTALENLIDHLHPQQHPQIKIVKDCAAAAVLIASLGSLCVASAFLWQLLD